MKQRKALQCERPVFAREYDQLIFGANILRIAFTPIVQLCQPQRALCVSCCNEDELREAVTPDLEISCASAASDAMRTTAVARTPGLIVEC